MVLHGKNAVTSECALCIGEKAVSINVCKTVFTSYLLNTNDTLRDHAVRIGVGDLECRSVDASWRGHGPLSSRLLISRDASDYLKR